MSDENWSCGIVFKGQMSRLLKAKNLIESVIVSQGCEVIHVKKGPKFFYILEDIKQTGGGSSE